MFFLLFVAELWMFVPGALAGVLPSVTSCVTVPGRTDVLGTDVQVPAGALPTLLRGGHPSAHRRQIWQKLWAVCFAVL